MSRSQVTSTVEQNTGGAVSPYVAGKNKVINGDFGIWQRGTSITIGVQSYWADRYSMDMVAAVPTGTASIQAFTPGTAPVAGYESNYFGRVNITANNNCTQYYIYQRIENVTTYAGQTATLSVWIKADAATNIGAYLVQNFGSGGSGAVVTTLSTSTSITNGWVRYTFTATVPSISGKTIGTGSSLEVRFVFPNSGSFVRVGTYDFWGVQLEAGSVATPFTTATGTLSGELAACQRYYYRWTANAAYSRYPVMGSAATSTLSFFPSITPVTLRTPPTALESSSNWRVYDGSGVVTGITLGIVVSTELELQPYFTATASSGLTQFRPYMLTANNDASAYIGLSAEL